MRKTRLLTPGPTPVPERVLLRMAQPILHHRSPDFEALFERVRGKLKKLFGTQQEVITFVSSGSGAMEASIVNFLRRGDKIIVVDGGKFGERFGKIAQAYGVEPIILKVEWGKAVDIAAVKKALDENPDVRAVCVQASETSTGVAHPVKEICELTRNHQAITIVDGITAVGVWDMPMDEWGIDILLSGSQKALMLPPGLAFAAVSEKAWKHNETANLPRFYFDIKKEHGSQKKNQTAWTAAVSLLAGLDEVLNIIEEEGYDELYARHDRMARASRAAMEALGLELFAENPSPAVTTVKAPEGLGSGKIVKHLNKTYGIRLVAGQDHVKDTIFRIAHLGYFDDFDVLTAINAIEMTLNDLGHPVARGKGVAAAQEILSA